MEARPSKSIQSSARLLYLLDFEAESTLSGLAVPVALFVMAMIFLALGRPDYFSSGGYLGFQHFLGFWYVYFLFVFLFLFNKVIGQPLSQRGFATTLLLPFSKRTVLCCKFLVAWSAGFGTIVSVLSLKWLLELPLLPFTTYLLELALIGVELFLLVSLWMLVAFAVRGLLAAILLEFAAAFALEIILSTLGVPFNQLSITFGEPLLYYPGVGESILGIPAGVTPFLVPSLGGLLSFLLSIFYFTRRMEVD